MTSHWVFDGLIAGILFSTGLTIIFFWLREKRKIKPSYTGRFLLGIVSLIFVTVLYGSFIEPWIIVLTPELVDISGGDPNGKLLKVAFVSDLHVGPYKGKKFVERMAKKINNQNPDIIVLGGDYVYSELPSSDYGLELEALSALKDLHAPLGVYAVLGNHDYFNIPSPLGEKAHTRIQYIRETLLEAGIQVLVDDAVLLKHQGNSFFLVGTNDVWANNKPLAGVLERTRENVPTLLLAHNPDVVLDFHTVVPSLKPDLVLAGHTHGGQIRIPFWGSVAPLPTKLGRDFDLGLLNYQGTPMFITKGIGESGPRARLFAPPEIALLSVKI